MTTVFIDANRLTDRQSAHSYLAEQFGFPDYYGNNLDALADCLSEKYDLHIIIQNSEGIACDSYAAKIISVLKKTAQDDESITLKTETDTIM